MASSDAELLENRGGAAMTDHVRVRSHENDDVRMAAFFIRRILGVRSPLTTFSPTDYGKKRWPRFRKEHPRSAPEAPFERPRSSTAPRPAAFCPGTPPPATKIGGAPGSPLEDLHDFRRRLPAPRSSTASILRFRARRSSACSKSVAWRSSSDRHPRGPPGRAPRPAASATTRTVITAAPDARNPYASRRRPGRQFPHATARVEGQRQSPAPGTKRKANSWSWRSGCGPPWWRRRS